MENQEITAESLAMMAHDEAVRLYTDHAGSDFDVIGTWYETVQHACHSAGRSVESVMSFPLYYWYYGNSLHLLLCLMLCPSAITAMMNEDGVVTSTSVFMSEKQCHNTIYVMFLMISKGEVSIDENDYFSMSPVTLLRFMVTSVTKHFRRLSESSGFPSYILQFSGKIEYILTRGPQLRTRQNHYIRRFLQWKQEMRQKKSAVMVIEDRFLEHVLSPYTNVGIRILQKRATRFASMALEQRI